MIPIFKYILLYFVLIFNFGCESKKVVPNDLFSKMISHRNLGLAYLEEERYADAVIEFKALLKISKTEPLGYANIGLAYMRMQGELKKSEEYLDTALVLAPDNPDIIFLLSKIYELTDRESMAKDLLHNIILKHPNHIKSLYQLSDTYTRSSIPNEKLKAIQYLDKVCEILPGNLTSSLKLIELLIDANDTSSALIKLQALSQTLPYLSQNTNEILQNIIILLHEKKVKEAKTPMIMFHNLLKPIEMYRASIDELRGTKGPIAGNPILHFLNTDIDSEKKIKDPNRYVSFENVSEQTQLNLINKKIKTAEINQNQAPIFTLGDFDLDGYVDIFLSAKSNIDNKNHSYLLRNNQGSFSNQNLLTKFKYPGQDISAYFTDYNNDGHLDLFICNSEKNRLYKSIEGGKYFKEIEINFQDNIISQRAQILDFDLEGDLDIFIATNEKNYLYRNNSDGSFTEIGEYAGLDGKIIKSIDVTFSDFDDDGDLELFVLNEDGSYFFYDNKRRSIFKDISNSTGIGKHNNPQKVSAVDYNNDGRIDICISSKNNHFLYKNIGKSKFELDPAWENTKTKIKKSILNGRSIFFDADNDGYQDLLISSTNPNALYLLYNNGNGKFIMPVFMKNVNHGNINQIEAGDYDNDGDLDLFISTTKNQIHLLKNNGGNLNNFIKIELTGLRTGSGKNNYFGIGSKIELKAEDLYQIKYMNQQSAHFGIGSRDNADILRVVWSNGVPQNHFKPKKNQKVIEKQILKGSCPYLFGWSGDQFEFITDVLWPSALGMPLGIMAGEPMYAFPNSTDEYLKISGEKLKIVDDSYLLQFTTELWETPYLDKVELMVIDHPKNSEVFIDETFIPPPYPKFKIYSVKDKYLPIKAIDSDGLNQLENIKQKDNNYVANLHPELYQGVTKIHDLILEFDKLNTSDSLFLFLQGWLFPTDASINVNLSQSDSLKSIFPYLQVPDEKGNWKTVINNIGFPKGKNKTMIIDLTNKFPHDDYRLRIRTNMQIYWDHIFIANNEPNSKIITKELKPTYANLHYRGFSKTSQKNQSSPHLPNYYSIDKDQKWRDLIGMYTKYGDVLELIMESDNKYVIMNSGDEVTLKFDAVDLPILPSDWTRDFLFYNDGWLKDGDLNTARGQTVMPLPFHGMTSYPEGAENKYPINSEYDSYRKKYNIRIVSTENFQEFIKKLK